MLMKYFQKECYQLVFNDVKDIKYDRGYITSCREYILKSNTFWDVVEAWAKFAESLGSSTGCIYSDSYKGKKRLFSIFGKSCQWSHDAYYIGVKLVKRKLEYKDNLVTDTYLVQYCTDLNSSSVKLYIDTKEVSMNEFCKVIGSQVDEKGVYNEKSKNKSKEK
jgi:hypothetical protein